MYTVMVSTMEQKIHTIVLIDASDPEDTVTMTTMMAAWVTGSVLTSKTNFMTTSQKIRAVEVRNAAVD